MSQPTAPAAPAAVSPGSAADAPATPPQGLKVQSKAPADPNAAREAEYQAALKVARGDAKPAAAGARDESGRFQKAAGESDGADDQVEGEVVEAETSEEVEGDDDESTDDESEEAETKEEEKSATKLKKYKVNGKEVEVDLGDAKKVDMLIQKGLGSDEAFAKASKVQKQALQFMEALRDNPLAILEHPKLGLDPKKLREGLERWLYEKVRYEAAPEDERRSIDERRELDRLREKDQKEQRAKEATKRAAAKEEISKRLTPMFIEAIEKADIPATDYTLRQMAHYMRLARARGMKSITPGDVAPLVARDWQTVQRQMFGRYDGQDLLKRLGDEHVRKVAKAHAESVTPGRSRQVKDPAPRAPVKTQAPKMPTFSTAEELRDYAMRGGK